MLKSSVILFYALSVLPKTVSLLVYGITACDYPAEEYDDEEDAEWNRQYDLQDEDNCNEWTFVCNNGRSNSFMESCTSMVVFHIVLSHPKIKGESC